MFEPGCGGNHRVIDDRVAEYLTGSRATKDGSPFEVSAQVAYEFTRLYQRSGAENEHHSWSFDFPRRQTRLPPVSLGPFVLCCFHEVTPSPKTAPGLAVVGPIATIMKVALGNFF